MINRYIHPHRIHPKPLPSHFGRSLGWVSFFLLFLFISCEKPKSTFVLEGKFKNFSQGTLYAYNMEQGRGRLDTIRLAESKFRYEIALDDSMTFCIIFPNFSEIPVFAEVGATAHMAGDASNLSEVTVTGTEDNDLMSKFQLETIKLSPPEVKKRVEKFVEEHPASNVSLFLVRKYMLLRTDPDYRKAALLLGKMVAAVPQWKEAVQLHKEVKVLATSEKKMKIPAFKATSIDGVRLSQADLSGVVNVVCAWATWDFDSQSMQRRLKPLKKEYGSRLQLMGICLDATVSECRKTMRRDSVTWPTICDGRMWDTPVVSTLGITEIPSNIVIDRSGHIVARNLSTGELIEKIKELMK